VVVLAVLDPNGHALSEDRAVFRDLVRGPAEDLGQMDGGVRIVVYTQKQHLPI
jgi:hypothetical protein